MKHKLVLPLGVTHIQHRDAQLDVAREAFGGFVRMTFTVTRTSREAYQIHIHHHDVPTARDGRMDYDETVGGLIGDTHQLGYDRKLTFSEVDADGSLTIEVESKH
jgi:hypothetical protein